MRFPHNAKIFRGQFEAAPYLCVFFLLVIFLLAQTAMVVVPGVPIELPVAADLPGADGPIAVVAVDENGTFYFENQMCDEKRLRERLKALPNEKRPGRACERVVKSRPKRYTVRHLKKDLD